MKRANEEEQDSCALEEDSAILVSVEIFLDESVRKTFILLLHSLAKV